MGSPRQWGGRCVLRQVGSVMQLDREIVYVMQKIYHVGVTSVEDLTPGPSTLFFSLPSSVPPRIGTHVRALLKN